MGLSSLSNAEREQASQMPREEVRRQFVSSRAGMRRVLGAACGVQAPDLDFVFGPYGKPQAPSTERRDIRFNLAHSGGVAVLAVARDVEVGIDIEKRRAIAHLRSVAARNFSSEELASLEGLTSNEEEEQFFRLWTRKEAVVKLLGLGLQQALTSFSVPSVVSLREAAAVRLPGARVCWLRDIPAPSGFHGALAANDKFGCTEFVLLNGAIAESAQN